MFNNIDTAKQREKPNKKIRKDNKGIEKVATYILAIGGKKVRLLTCNIETEVLFSNQYKMVSVNISQVKRL